MELADLFRETLDVDCDEVWENERTPTSVRVFGVRLHSMGLSLRETVAIFEWLGVDRSHGAIWNWTHVLSEAQADPSTAEPSWIAVDDKQIEVDGEEKWLYAAIDTDSKLLLEIDVFSRRGTDPAAFTRAKLSLASQNAKRSDDGVSPSPDREPRGLRYRLSRRCRWVSDGTRSSGVEWAARLQRTKPHRKVVSKLSRCGSIVFTRSGGGVQPAPSAG